MLNKAGLGCSLQCALQRYLCVVENLPQKLSHKPYLHEGNQYQGEILFIEIPGHPMQVEKLARAIISKYNLLVFLALMWMLQVRLAHTNSHVVQANTELSGSQSSELSQKKKHFILKKKKKLPCKRRSLKVIVPPL